MLPLSRKPEVIRLHQLENVQRNRYINQCTSTLQQWLPQSCWPLIPVLSDIYYTFTTIRLCRKRLGQQYTYVTMYNPAHYEHEGVLVNTKTRTLMFILQIIQRHLVKNLLIKLWGKIEDKLERTGAVGMGHKGNRILGEIVAVGVDGCMEYGRLGMLMLFMLGWNRHFNVIDTLLGNQYAYTFLNKNNATVDYRIEGYLLLVVFITKFIKFTIKSYKILTTTPKKPLKSSTSHSQPQSQPLPNSNPNSKLPQPSQPQKQQQLCRICYDSLKNKSVTCCGHIFCWECIIRYLLARPECPVCRAQCQPREVIQLQNY